MESHESIWLAEPQVRMLHAESVRLFGGLPGVRDVELLQSALARPQQRWAYGEAPDLFDLAAAHAFGLARNHAFLDGNKRIALLSIRTFLFLNGFRFDPDQVETVTMVEGLAAGAVEEATVADWIRRQAVPR